MDIPASPSVVLCRAVCKSFRGKGHAAATQALDGVALTVPTGAMVALVGPDGAGKTTLIRLIMGLMPPDSGAITVLGHNIVQSPHAAESSVSYMPQKFGLYEDLTVQENLDLYADLHNVSTRERRERYPILFSMTNLGRFSDRLAGRLSGGMKQKLGLACALVQSPRLLVLDEPTVGVDPVSRRELWSILLDLVKQQSLTVLVSTPYLEEAELCGHTVVMFQGRILAEGAPQAVADYARQRTFHLATRPGVQPRRVAAAWLTNSAVVDAVPEGGQVRVVFKTPAGATATPPSVPDEPGFRGAGPDVTVFKEVQPHFADGFMVLLRQAMAPPRDLPASPGGGAPLPVSARGAAPPPPQTAATPSAEPVVEVRDLVRRFGNFVAVDQVNFQISRGEIFGLLGPNGAGKSTTFRMLCGLLPLTSGTLRVAGHDLRHARASARQTVGYVAQKFSLYSHLSVRDNLEFFASAYGLRGRRRRQRLAWAVAEFGFAALLASATGRIPDGFKRRLAMACALLHEPRILFLDEPTSGVDPLARREFWKRITAMADEGVTVVVTTHFMEEAEYCDRMVIMMNGRILAQGTPAAIRQLGATAAVTEPTMEDAFIHVVRRDPRRPSSQAGT
jgi:ABC-2 type transport system ATP-binding protein